MRYFGFGIFLGFTALIGSMVTVGVVVANFAPDSMPAPAISRLVHVDEKLRFIREHPGIKPTVLAVGSSITWRQLDGGAFREVAGGPGHFLNGGTVYLQVHQTRSMTRFYLDRYPSVRTLVVMLSLPDFGNCTTEPEEIFEPEDAARYAFEDWPAAYFYPRYFSPQRYVRTAMTLAGRRTPLIGDLYLDAYGSGPLQVPERMLRGLRYGQIAYDPACVAALDRLVADTTAKGVKLLLVFAPVHPDYRAQYPDDVAWLTQVAAGVAAEGKDDGKVVVLDMIDDPAYTPDDFFDAFHLQWSAVKILSRRIVTSMQESPAAQRKGQIVQEVERWAGRPEGKKPLSN